MSGATREGFQPKLRLRLAGWPTVQRMDYALKDMLFLAQELVVLIKKHGLMWFSTTPTPYPAFHLHPHLRLEDFLGQHGPVHRLLSRLDLPVDPLRGGWPHQTPDINPARLYFIIDSGRDVWLELQKPHPAVLLPLVGQNTKGVPPNSIVTHAPVDTHVLVPNISRDSAIVVLARRLVDVLDRNFDDGNFTAKPTLAALQGTPFQLHENGPTMYLYIEELHRWDELLQRHAHDIGRGAGERTNRINTDSLAPINLLAYRLWQLIAKFNPGDKRVGQALRQYRHKRPLAENIMYEDPIHDEELDMRAHLPTWTPPAVVPRAAFPGPDEDVEMADGGDREMEEGVDGLVQANGEKRKHDGDGCGGHDSEASEGSGGRPSRRRRSR